MTSDSKSNGFTRREVLAAFLGLPIALTACNSSKGGVSLPPGDLIGASDLVGHRLRDGQPPEIPADRWKQIGVVIVGGGVAGLSAAWRLKRDGFNDFALLELEKAPGGTARSGESKVAAYPWGAHYIPAPSADNPALITLLNEMGMLDGRTPEGEPIVAEQYLCRDPEERVFYRGRWYDGLYLRAGADAEDLRQLAAFEAEINRWVGWRDARGRRAFTIPTAYGSDDAEVTALDRLSMADWLDQRKFNSPRLRWLVAYACRDDYGSQLQDTSAWAGLFYFTSRVPKPGAASAPLITWPEGNGRLVRHLYSQVSDHVQLGGVVTEVIPGDDKPGVAVTAVDRDGQNAFGIRAGQVVFAAPHFLARYLIRPWRDSAPAYANEFQYGAWMVANLTLRDRPAAPGFPLCWDNVIYEGSGLGYVVATHQRGIDRGPTVFTYYYPLCDSDPRMARNQLLSVDRAGWADIALTDLSRAHPEIRELTERLDVMRWGHAMIRPRPGFIWSGARQKAQQPFRNVHFAHSDLSGVALFEEAFYHGIRAAEEIMHDRGMRFKAMI